MKISELGEFGLIDRLKRLLPPLSKRSLVGIGDDASVFRPDPSCDLVMSTDMLVQDVHFAARTMSFRDVGWKSLAASISDIAAMGAEPRQAVISLAIPAEIDVEHLIELYEGVAEIATLYEVDVVGGDTVKTGDKLVVSVTLTGEVPHGKSLLRSGARPGDLVFVTGTVGGSAAGLHALLHADQVDRKQLETIARYHQRPLPQTAFGSWLSRSGACHALNDISDGVSSESNEIAKASGVQLELEADLIPIAEDVREYCAKNQLDPVDFALYGGEDYQLIGCLDPMRWEEAVDACRRLGSSLHRIGSVVKLTENPFVTLRLPPNDETGRSDSIQTLTAKGYNHFRS